jgi:hypothetical protein
VKNLKQLSLFITDLLKKGLFIIISILLTVTISLTIYFVKQKQNTKQDAASPIIMNNLHIVGNKIVNGSGQTILFHGVNRPSFEYSCIDGSEISEGPVNQSEVDTMKNWNINAVRVVLNEDCWLGIHDMASAVSGANYQTAVTNYINLLTQNDIAVIINLHFNGDGNSKAIEQEPMADRTNSNTFWTSLANTFKENNSVIFEPYNEPHDITWQCWRDGGTCSGVSFQVAGMQEMINAIRNTGATNIIIATGNNWGSDLSQWLQYKPTDSANQLAAGWHTYNDGLSCEDSTCWNSTLAEVLLTTPIVATEIGEFDCNHTHIDKVMQWLETQQQGYFAWAWTPSDCSSEPALITDWNGNPTQTFGQGFKDHLITLPLQPTIDQETTPTMTIPPSPTLITPTNYCLGSCPSESITPTINISPSQPLPNQTISPSPSTITATPTNVIPSNILSITPTRAPENGNTNKGLIGFLLQLLTMLLTMILKLFGNN